MPEQPYQMIFQDGVIVVTFEKGFKITPECILELIDKENKSFDAKRFNALWDFRGALPSDNFGYDAIERIIYHINSRPEVYWNPLLAILVDAGVQYGLSRIFQSLTNPYPMEMRIFNSEAEAMAWVVGNAAAEGSEDDLP